VSEPSFYCPNAGPGGNGVCGENCDALCGIAEKICVGPDQVWPDQEACRAECAGFPDLKTFTIDTVAAMYLGSHIQCRLYHISVAAVEDPLNHCLHVGGEAPCNDDPPPQ